MRPRFRLRTLLLLTALLAAVCYWWVARPTNTARRFAQAVESGDYPAASRMLDPHPQSNVLESVFQIVPKLQEALRQQSAADERTTTDNHAPFVVTLEPLSWKDALGRVRHFTLLVRENNEIVSVVLGLDSSSAFAVRFVARPDGIEIVTPDLALGRPPINRLSRQSLVG